MMMMSRTAWHVVHGWPMRLTLQTIDTSLLPPLFSIAYSFFNVLINVWCLLGCPSLTVLPPQSKCGLVLRPHCLCNLLPS